jgi:hypothetical protein
VDRPGLGWFLGFAVAGLVSRVRRGWAGFPGSPWLGWFPGFAVAGLVSRFADGSSGFEHSLRGHPDSPGSLAADRDYWVRPLLSQIPAFVTGEPISGFPDGFITAGQVQGYARNALSVECR